MKTLAEVLLASAAAYAEQPALWVDGETISYRDLADRAFGIANALSAVTTRITAIYPDMMNRRTAIYADRHVWAYAGIAGAVLAGHTYVPLNPRHPLDRLRAILHRADVGALVLGQQALEACRPLIITQPPMTVIVPDGTRPEWWGMCRDHRFVGAADLRSTPTTPAIDPSDGAYLLFTSGSTGEPKGVTVTHENVMAYLRTALDRYRLTPDDRTTQLFDLTFDLSVHDLFVTWAAGATLYCPSENARKAPLQFVTQHKLTCWFSTPATVALMARMRMLQPDNFPTLRWSLFCGEAFPRRLAAQWMAAAPNSLVDNLYGPTEATIAITGFRLPADLSELPDVVPIGQPFEGQSVAIQAPDDELLLSGSQVTSGYWRQPDLTEERFLVQDGRRWYRTGDRVALSEFGLCYLGRVDRQVKIAGNRVELQEVETVLRRAAACDTVAAIAWPLRDGLAHGIVALVAAESRADDVVLTECRNHLAPYMVPSRVVRLREWPLNSNGKTDYLSLVEILASSEV